MMQNWITLRGIQNNFACLYGARGSIVWDIYGEQDKPILEHKISVLIPDLELEDDNPTISASQKLKQKEARQRENEKLSQLRKDLVETLWAQRKYSNGKLLMTILYVGLARIEGELKKKQNMEKAADTGNFTCHPLFRIRRCSVNNDSSDCCMIFVDEYCRVYPNWEDFKKENKYPAGILVAPKNGIYSNPNEEVDLECFLSQAASLPAKALIATDVAVNATALIGGGVLIAAMFTPIGLAALAVSAAVSAGSGVYGIVRSSVNLADRGLHEQTINVTDREARGCWLGIASGAAGVASVGASQALKLVSAGKAITTAAKVAVNGVNIASMTINGMGIANGVVDIGMRIHKKESVSVMECLQLSTSLVLFTHSLYNFKLISQIATNSEKNFTETLMDRQKSFFENLRSRTADLGKFFNEKFDAIRGVNQIPDIPEYFGSMSGPSVGGTTMNIAPLLNIAKDFAQSASIENVLSKICLEVGNMAAEKLIQIACEFIGKYSRKFEEFENFLFADKMVYTIYKLLLRKFGYNNIGDRILSTTVKEIFDFLLQHFESLISNVSRSIAEAVSSIRSVNNIADLKNCLINIFENLSVQVATSFINMVKTAFARCQDSIQKLIKRIISFEEFLWVSFKTSLSIAGPVTELNSTVIALNVEDIENRVREYYSAYAIDRQNETKCRMCRGYYSKMKC